MRFRRIVRDVVRMDLLHHVIYRRVLTAVVVNHPIKILIPVLMKELGVESQINKQTRALVNGMRGKLHLIVWVGLRRVFPQVFPMELCVATEYRFRHVYRIWTEFVGKHVMLTNFPIIVLMIV